MEREELDGQEYRRAVGEKNRTLVYKKEQVGAGWEEGWCVGEESEKVVGEV